MVRDSTSPSALLGQEVADICGNRCREVAPLSGGGGDQVGHCPNKALICRGAASGAKASPSALLGEEVADIGGNRGQGFAPPSGGGGDQVGHCPNEALIRRGAASGAKISILFSFWYLVHESLSVWAVGFGSR